MMKKVACQLKMEIDGCGDGVKVIACTNWIDRVECGTFEEWYGGVGFNFCGRAY